MGGFSSVMTGLSLVGNLIGGYAQDNADYRAQKAQQEENYRYAVDQAAAKREQVRLQGEADEATRQAALKRSVARQRASYGASGIASSEGSGRAVLLGLFDESEDERRRREELDKLRYHAIESDLAHERNRNVLSLSAQRDRKNIAQIIGLTKTAGGAGKLLD